MKQKAHNGKNQRALTNGEVASLLKKLVKTFGTQKEFARRSGVSQPILSLSITEKRRLSAKSATKIAKALKRARKSPVIVHALTVYAESLRPAHG